MVRAPQVRAPQASTKLSADYRCSHSIAISGGDWPDDLRLSDIEGRFVCGERGADVRPDFSWNKTPAKAMDYR